MSHCVKGLHASRMRTCSGLVHLHCWHTPQRLLQRTHCPGHTGHTTAPLATPSDMAHTANQMVCILLCSQRM